LTTWQIFFLSPKRETGSVSPVPSDMMSSLFSEKEKGRSFIELGMKKNLKSALVEGWAKFKVMKGSTFFDTRWHV